MRSFTSFSLKLSFNTTLVWASLLESNANKFNYASLKVNPFFFNHQWPIHDPSIHTHHILSDKTDKKELNTVEKELKDGEINKHLLNMILDTISYCYYKTDGTYRQIGTKY